MFRLLLVKGSRRDKNARMALCHHINNCCYYRGLSSSAPRRGSWASLSESQRAAWEVLGWDADRWEDHGRSRPQSSFNKWSNLSAAEQAAAKYGLGYTPEAWDANTSRSGDGRFDVTVNKDKRELWRTPKSVPVDASVFGAPTKKSKNKESMASSLAQAAWTVAKAVAPNTVNTLTESMAPPVVVDGIETTLYLDDSPSMNESTGWFSFTSRLEQGRKVLSSLAPVLGSLPCRVLKFSNTPTVLSIREENNGKGGGISSSLPQITTGWDGSGNGTYLWHMIQTDVMERYRPGTGRLRLVVVTDGQDNLSPSGYQGMDGMDPMMRTLQKAGYDIEWHIIVIGGESGLERYEALAGATGGSFLAVKNEFDERSREAAAFLEAIESSTDEHGRRERQRRYEIDRDAGKADRFDWFKKLPPPDSKT